jgi:hypothetical protein
MVLTRAFLALVTEPVPATFGYRPAGGSQLRFPAELSTGAKNDA